MKKIFLATTNGGKIQRYKYLLESAGVEAEIYTTKDFGLENIEVAENGKTLAENAEIKARAYFGKVEMPIIGNDTGFYVEGEGFIDAPKRMALGEEDESKFSKEQISQKLLEFWKSVARKHGGRVDAAWVEAFIRLDPDGKIYTSESRREIILTDQVFGDSHIQLPVRALYISKATNKPSLQQTKEEELLELKPVIDALRSLVEV